MGDSEFSHSMLISWGFTPLCNWVEGITKGKNKILETALKFNISPISISVFNLGFGRKYLYADPEYNPYNEHDVRLFKKSKFYLIKEFHSNRITERKLNFLLGLKDKS